MATTEEIRASLAQHLEALGATSQEVAVKLTELDCKGRITRTTLCPVAVYLKRCGFPSAGVSQRTVLVDPADWDDAELISIRTPDPVARFIDDFDDGAYPGLIINPRKES